MSSTVAGAVVEDGRPSAAKPSGAPARLSLAAVGPVQLMALACALCAFVAGAFAPQMLWDGDTFWHIATGDWMLAHHQVVRADPFSYSVPGKAWVDLEWLSEVLMAPVYAAGGWSGLQLLFALALGALGWILSAELLRKLPAFSCAAALFLALACTTQSWLARPHLLALPILAFWTVQLLKAREAGRAPPLWLLPVMVVWANLHGSFLFGLALLGPFAAEAVLEAGPDRLKAVRDWGLFGVAAGLASLITPHGIDGLIYPVKLMTMRSLPDIVEWQSSNFSRMQPLELALLTALFVLLYRGVKVPVVRLITLLGLLHLTLHETRHQMVLAVVGVLLLAEPLGRALAGTDPVVRLPRLSPPARAGVLAAMLLVFAGTAVARTLVPAHLIEAPTAPIAALAHVPEDLRRRPVLNEYAVGGYLIHNHVRPFIDGRADMYGDDFVQAYMKLKHRDLAQLKATLARYQVRWTLLGADDPVVKDMDALPGWKRLYADKTAVVHVKTAG